MQWNYSDAIGTSLPSCVLCEGLGLRIYNPKPKRKPKANRVPHPCNCTLRGTFRACLNRFRDLVEKPKSLSRATLEHSEGFGQPFHVWGRKDEEYLADFYLIAKRTLDERHFQIFKFYFMLGADHKLCCRRLNMNRGNFFHAVYRIEQLLGRAFRETEPYALFPLDEYFGGAIRKALPSEYAALKLLEMPKAKKNRKKIMPVLLAS